MTEIFLKKMLTKKTVQITMKYMIFSLERLKKILQSY